MARRRKHSELTCFSSIRRRHSERSASSRRSVAASSDSVTRTCCASPQARPGRDVDPPRRERLRHRRAQPRVRDRARRDVELRRQPRALRVAPARGAARADSAPCSTAHSAPPAPARRRRARAQVRPVLGRRPRSRPGTPPSRATFENERTWITRGWSRIGASSRNPPSASSTISQCSPGTRSSTSPVGSLGRHSTAVRVPRRRARRAPASRPPRSPARAAGPSPATRSRPRRPPPRAARPASARPRRARSRPATGSMSCEAAIAARSAESSG